LFHPGNFNKPPLEDTLAFRIPLIYNFHAK
jgi:hypothetical protein